MENPENIKRKNPFKVPDKYFEDVNSRILAQTSEKKHASGKIATMRIIRPYLLAAASLAGIALITYAALELFSDRNMRTELSYNEIISDPAMIDIDLYTIEEQFADFDLPYETKAIGKKEIVDYLLLENIDTEEIIEIL